MSQPTKNEVKAIRADFAGCRELIHDAAEWAKSHGNFEDSENKHKGSLAYLRMAARFNAIVKQISDEIDILDKLLAGLPEDSNSGSAGK